MEKLNEIQEYIQELMKKYHLNAGIENRYISLSSELGELGKEIVKGNKYGNRQFEKTENFEMELGDVLFDYILLCNVAKVDIQQAFEKALLKYETRFVEQGSIGSTKI